MSDNVERKFGDLKVIIDRETCIATENCIEVAPEVFRMDDTQLCAFTDDGGEVDREKLLEACRICPVEALTVVGAEGRQLVP